MTHPDIINIDGSQYPIESDAIYRDVATQLENLMRAGRILLRIQTSYGEYHVLVADGTSLNFLIQND